MAAKQPRNTPKPTGVKNRAAYGATLLIPAKAGVLIKKPYRERVEGVEVAIPPMKQKR